MSSIVIYGDTSGAITLAANAVAGTNTLTLPNNTGTVISTGSSNVVTQSMLSTGVAGNGPAFSAYLSTNQSMSATTWTKIQCNTEIFDTASAYDNATNYRFQPTVAGYYQANCGASITGSPSSMYIAFYKNGSISLRNYFGAGQAAFSGLFYLNGSTDYLEAYVYVYGSPSAINGLNTDTFFQGAMVRGA